jgi:hypothetical protein
MCGCPILDIGETGIEHDLTSVHAYDGVGEMNVGNYVPRPERFAVSGNYPTPHRFTESSRFTRIQAQWGRTSHALELSFNELGFLGLAWPR